MKPGYKSPICFLFVIPAPYQVEDRFRGSDSILDFYETIKFGFILRVLIIIVLVATLLLYVLCG